MTIVRPWRLITRQRSHMGLTDGRTFIWILVSRRGLFETERDSTAGEIVRRELDLDPVAGENADVVLAHLPGDGREDAVTAVELNPEHRAGERLDDLAFDLDLLFLDRHVRHSRLSSHSLSFRTRTAPNAAGRMGSQVV